MRIEPYQSGIPSLRWRLILTPHEFSQLKDRLLVIYAWCNSQFGTYAKHWGMRQGTTGTELFFSSEADAMHFTLRWREPS